MDLPHSLAQARGRGCAIREAHHATELGQRARASMRTGGPHERSFVPDLNVPSCDQPTLSLGLVLAGRLHRIGLGLRLCSAKPFPVNGYSVEFPGGATVDRLFQIHHRVVHSRGCSEPPLVGGAGGAVPQVRVASHPIWPYIPLLQDENRCGSAANYT